MMIDRSGAFTQARIRFDRAGDILLGDLHCVSEIPSFCQFGSNAGGIRAARPMRMRRGNAWRPVFQNFSSPVQDVDCIPFEMSAFDQHSLGSQSRDSSRRFLHRCKIEHRHAGQFAGFAQVGSHKKSLRQQKVRKRSTGLVRHERLPVLADHHGIDYERKFEIRAFSATRRTISRLPSAPVFAAAGRNILQNCFQLRCNDIRGKDFHGADFLRVLHRHQRHNAFAIDSPLVKSFQVRLDSRSTGWIRACNSQCYGNVKSMPMGLAVLRFPYSNHP